MGKIEISEILSRENIAKKFPKKNLTYSPHNIDLRYEIRPNDDVIIIETTNVLGEIIEQFVFQVASKNEKIILKSIDDQSYTTLPLIQIGKFFTAATQQQEIKFFVSKITILK